MHSLAIEDISVVLPIAPEQAATGNTLVRTVADETIAAVVRPRVLKKNDRFSQIAMVAFAEVEEAMNDAVPDRVGLFIANDFGGWGYVQQQLKEPAPLANGLAKSRGRRASRSFSEPISRASSPPPS